MPEKMGKQPPLKLKSAKYIQDHQTYTKIHKIPSGGGAAETSPAPMRRSRSGRGASGTGRAGRPRRLGIFVYILVRLIGYPSPHQVQSWPASQPDFNLSGGCFGTDIMIQN